MDEIKAEVILKSVLIISFFGFMAVAVASSTIGGC